MRSTGSPFALPLVLDGGTGTHLIAAGMPAGACPEQWILDNPKPFCELAKAYVQAGSQAVLAPSFGANRAKLSDYGLGGKVKEINKTLVYLTKEAAGESALIGGDLSPTGLFIEPYGDADFEQLVDIYSEQAGALVEAGVDFLMFETMLSLWECRAGILAARGLGVPVFCTITVDENGKTLMGASLPSCVVTLGALGAAAVGINCSFGPEGLDELFYRASVCARVPLIAKPNAGKPLPDGGFDLSPADFAGHMAKLARAGVSIFGGCCGTGPEHIAAIKSLAPSEGIYRDDSEVLANESTVFFLPEEPSGLYPSRPLSCGYSLEDELIDMEDERVNLAVVRVESEDDARLLSELAPVARLPISILSDSEAALRLALRLFHGRAMVDSSSAIENGSLMSIAREYGAIVF